MTVTAHADKRHSVPESRRWEDASRIATMIESEYIESNVTKLGGQHASLAELRVLYFLYQCLDSLSRDTSVHSHTLAFETDEQCLIRRNRNGSALAPACSEDTEAKHKHHQPRCALNTSTTGFAEIEDRVEGGYTGKGYHWC